MNSLEAMAMTTAIMKALQHVRYYSADAMEKFGAELHGLGYMIVKNPDFVPTQTPIVVEEEIPEAPASEPKAAAYEADLSPLTL